MTVIQPKKRKNLDNELKFRTTRLRVFVWVGKDPQPIKGHAFVNEVKKKGLAIYASRKLPLHTVVMVAFEDENAKPFRAKVLGNESKAENQALAKESQNNWKISFAFEFPAESEAKRYGEFWQGLRRKIAMLARPVKQANYEIVDGKDDDSEIDEAISDFEIGGPKKKGAA